MRETVADTLYNMATVLKRGGMSFYDLHTIVKGDNREKVAPLIHYANCINNDNIYLFIIVYAYHS